MANQAILTNALHLQPSELYVGDLLNMARYYQYMVGLDVLESSKTSVTLGHDEIAIITLVAKPNLAFAPPSAAGLFHNAIVYSTRGDLATAAGTIASNLPQTFTGTGDHLVSEAFYFNDPEGNGLELYYDRPQTSWQWQDGQIKMDTLYIDPVHYINTHASEKSGAQRKLGHVHLKIGDIQSAEEFYVKMLGFDVTARVPGALFISVGGYHHHIGLNTWISKGAAKRTPTLGLSEVTITLDTSHDVNKLAVRIEAAGVPFTAQHGDVHVTDPWGNQLRFTSAR